MTETIIKEYHYEVPYYTKEGKKMRTIVIRRNVKKRSGFPGNISEELYNQIYNDAEISVRALSKKYDVSYHVATKIRSTRADSE